MRDAIRTEFDLELAALERQIRLYVKVGAALEFKIPRGSRERESGPLLSVILTHAVALTQLAKPVELPADLGAAPFYAWSSVAAIERAMLECYLSLHEVFWAERSEAEKEFDYLIWRLAGSAVHLGHIATDDETSEAADGWEARYEELLSQLHQNDVYKEYDDRKRKAVDGTVRRHQRYLRERSRGNRCAAAGLGPKWAEQYSYLSCHAHGGSLSARQVSSSAGSLVDQMMLLEGSLVGASAILAKITMHYLRQWPDLLATIGGPLTAYREAQILDEAAEHLGEPDEE